MKKNKFMSIIIAALFFISIIPVSATDIFSDIELQLAEIDTYILDCEESELDCEMQKADAEIIRQFIKFGREDLSKGNNERAEYMLAELTKIAHETSAELKNILESGKGISVPMYSGEKLSHSGMNFVDTDGKNKFFGGYLTFGSGTGGVSDFYKLGSNLYSWEIGPRSTMVTEGTFLPSWTTTLADGITIDTDHSTVYEGNTSIKLASTVAMTSGVYSELKQSITTKPNTQYTVEFWVKADSALGNIVYLNGDSDRKTLPTGTYDWKKVSYTVTTGDSGGILLRFLAQHTTNGLWIDNITVKETGTDFNVIDNGNFERKWASNGEFLVNEGCMNYIKSKMHSDYNNGISAMILISPHYIPEWFFDNYPEAYYYQEGFLKGHVENDVYKKFIKTHTQAVVKAASEYPNLHSIVITNEPVYNTSYYTNGQQFKPYFVEFLKRKYNSVNTNTVPAQLRENWGWQNDGNAYLWSKLSLHPDLMSIGNTISSTGRYWDWMEYNNEVFSGFHNWLCDVVHEVDKTVPVHAKLFSNTFSRLKLSYGTDIEIIYPYLDYNGFDGGMNYNSSREGFLQIRMAEDLANSISDTPLVNSENHIIPDDCSDYSDKHAKIAGADLWQGFLHGRTASAAWLWRRHDTWSEYRNSLAYRPDVISETSEKTMKANKFAEELNKLQYTDKNFYILYSVASLLYNEAEYMSACYNSYEALWAVGQKPSFITEKQIASGKLDNNAILVIPSTSNIDDCALDNLNTFTGNTIVIGNIPTKNEYNLSINLNLKNAEVIENNLSQITSVYERLLKERTENLITVRNTDGSLLEMTDIRVSEDENTILINMCNNTWNTIENVSVYYGDEKLEKEGIDLLSDTVFSDTFTLEPFEPVLLNINLIDDYNPGQDIPGWNVKNDVVGTTVERVFHENYNSWMLKLTNDGTGKDIDKVSYIIPRSKLTQGHTYKITMFSDIDTDVTANAWIYFMGGGVKYGNTFVPNHKNGITISVQGADLYTNNKVYFGFDTNFVGEWYLDNLVITDEITGETINLENFGFENITKDYLQKATETNMQGWTVNKSSSYKIDRVYNFVTGSRSAKITTTGKGGAWNALVYYIPKDKLIEGRTYTVKADILSDALTNASNPEQWVALDFGGTTDTPWVHNIKNNAVTITKTGIKLFSNNKISFGLTHAKVDTLYVDNLKIIDESTGEELNLVNTDFELPINPYVEFSYDGNVCKAVISSAEKSYSVYIIFAVYDEYGNLTEINTDTYEVYASDKSQSITAFPDNVQESYTIKAMIWNADTLEPLAIPLVIN